MVGVSDGYRRRVCQRSIDVRTDRLWKEGREGKVLRGEARGMLL